MGPVSYTGATPLHIAAANGCTDAAHLLIQYGASVVSKCVSIAAAPCCCNMLALLPRAASLCCGSHCAVVDRVCVQALVLALWRS